MGEVARRILEVNELTVQYRLEQGYVTAVDNVSLTLDSGDSLGIVGESGSGKSTLAFAIMGILPENARITSGKILFEGQNLREMSDSAVRRKIRWKKISMIFQSSMNALNPVYKVGSILVDVAKFKEGVTKTEAEKTVVRLFELVGMSPSRMGNYPHQYSGGMRQRAVIAMSLICNPALIIADEPTTALDVVVQDQILKTLKKLQNDFGMSVIVISHDVAVIGTTCARVAVMYGGKIFEAGPTSELFTKPNNPYTRALLECFPNIKNPKKRLVGIPGDAPNLTREQRGCLFAPRCSFARKLCRDEPPPLVQIAPGHFSLCHFAEELTQ